MQLYKRNKNKEENKSNKKKDKNKELCWTGLKLGNQWNMKRRAFIALKRSLLF